MAAGANMASALPRHGRHKSSAVRMQQQPESIPPARRDTGMCLLGETAQVIILLPKAPVDETLPASEECGGVRPGRYRQAEARGGWLARGCGCGLML